MSHDVNLNDNLNYSKGSQSQNIVLTHRSKNRVCDYTQNSESTNSNAEVTIRQIKNKFRTPPSLASVSSKSANLKNYKNQENLLLLHEQRFHPEMTNKYNFKEGKHLLINTVNEQS